jgi:N-acetylglucosaminyl-diphospho-decaprenol L-rhamnosyltransferase
VFDVDCVIVSYNSAHDLPRCIGSMQGQVGLRMTITVVDNASADDSAAVAAGLGVKVVRNEENRGFAAAVNQGLRGSDSPWVLTFNPDAALPEGGVQRLIETAVAGDQIGCVGPRVVGEDGVEYPSGRRFPNIRDAVVHALLGKAKPNNSATGDTTPRTSSGHPRSPSTGFPAAACLFHGPCGNV